MIPAGMPVSRIASRSARSACERGQVREHARVEHGQQPGQLGLGDVLGELACRAAARPRFHRSFCAHRHDDLVEQRVAEPGDLGVRAGPLVAVVVAEAALLAVGRRPHADDRIRAPSRRSGRLPSRVSWLIGTWMAMRVHVERLQRVDAGHGRQSG